MNVFYDTVSLKGESTMEYKLIIDKEKEEYLHLLVHERNELVEKIESLIEKPGHIILGYKDEEVFRLKLMEASCFFTNNNKIYAHFTDEKYLLKERLYKIEELLDESFIRINQGCIVNINHIEKFEMSVGGTIKVVLKNGFEDYISRRNLKEVKGRLGI